MEIFIAVALAVLWLHTMGWLAADSAGHAAESMAAVLAAIDVTEDLIEFEQAEIRRGRAGHGRLTMLEIRRVQLNRRYAALRARVRARRRVARLLGAGYRLPDLIDPATSN